MIDTGATVNILDQHTYKQIGSPKISKRNLPKLLPYGGRDIIPIEGSCEIIAEKNNKMLLTKFYIVKGNHGSILGYQTAIDLGLIQIIKQVETDMAAEKYPNLFVGIGKLKSQKVKIHIDETVKPVAQTQRRTPFHLRGKVEREIEKLLEEDIIEKVEHEPTPWISPIVTPPKKNGEDIRLCVDMRQANMAIQRERHLIPTIDELVNDLNGAQIFRSWTFEQDTIN